MLTHIISATTIVLPPRAGTLEEANREFANLAMCGHVLGDYRAAVDAGHVTGNYLGQYATLSAYHARGVDCESCIARHQCAGGR